jgi:hypothetical protein
MVVEKCVLEVGQMVGDDKDTQSPKGTFHELYIQGES